MIDNLSMTFRQNSQRTNAAKKEKAFGQRNPAKRTARGVAASKAFYVFGCLKRMVSFRPFEGVTTGLAVCKGKACGILRR